VYRWCKTPTEEMNYNFPVFSFAGIRSNRTGLILSSRLHGGRR
jgi:hypothetical protein